MEEQSKDEVDSFLKQYAEVDEQLEAILDRCLHPERNGLLIKEKVAEGASHEHLIKRELKSAITALIQEAVNEGRAELLEAIEDYQKRVDKIESLAIYLNSDMLDQTLPVRGKTKRARQHQQLKDNGGSNNE